MKIIPKQGIYLLYNYSRKQKKMQTNEQQNTVLKVINVSRATLKPYHRQTQQKWKYIKIHITKNPKTESRTLVIIWKDNAGFRYKKTNTVLHIKSHFVLTADSLVSKINLQAGKWVLWNVKSSGFAWEKTMYWKIKSEKSTKRCTLAQNYAVMWDKYVHSPATQN